MVSRTLDLRLGGDEGLVIRSSETSSAKKSAKQDEERDLEHEGSPPEPTGQ